MGQFRPQRCHRGVALGQDRLQFPLALTQRPLGCPGVRRLGGGLPLDLLQLRPRRRHIGVALPQGRL